MYILCNFNNLFDILFKYKFYFFVKLSLINYIKIYTILTYLVRFYNIYKRNITKHIKDRSLVNFSNRKIRVQKGLGKARLKNFTSPICKQGGSIYKFYKDFNLYKLNKLTYKLVYIYLILNKRSNIIIFKFNYILFFLSIINYNYNCSIFELILKILYFNGIIKSKYFIINRLQLYLNNNYKYIIINLLKFNYIIYIV